MTRRLSISDDSDMPDQKRQKASSESELSPEDLHQLIRTINNKKLDFDSDRICSVTLTKLNIYGCLTCGKFFKGYKERSPAFLHSISENHRLFISLKNHPNNIIVLPDELEINGTTPLLSRQDQKLVHDIIFATNPTYDKTLIQSFPQKCHDCTQDQLYYNGYVGLNKSISNGITYINVLVQLLAHIIPIRDYFLLYNGSTDTLIGKISIIIKKIWSPHLFKLNIAPDELISHLLINFPKIFNGSIRDPQFLLNWLINQMCQLDPLLKKLLNKTCRGKLKTQGKTVPFWNLTIILPTVSMFKDGKNIDELPQVNLQNMIVENFLNKSNGKIIEQFPRYLFVYITRFDTKLAQESRDEFVVKNRNQTIVNFSESLTLPVDSKNKITYKIISNIVHDPQKNLLDIEKDYKSNWKIQLLKDSKVNDWMEIDNIKVSPKNFNLMFLDESYIQVWERQ
ncbi:hypothetical protein C6P45_004473 [Maudiozyma exigua]|uniref:USP domain-containing protein n=1 Tax=Maudiozyma exigua TaxID=34358 RepID=A0A9P7BB59_MAUEX|nr:hypothetical protein C6P45_004473 [Kazachstania exigua]